MAFTKTMVPLRARDSFFRDEFFSDCWDVMERQKKEFEQKCAESALENQKLRSSILESSSRHSGAGTALDRLDDELFPYSPPRRFQPYYQRYHPASLMIMDSDHLARKYASGLGIHYDRDNFKVSLDVQQFSPEELTVKTVDSTIIIEGKHEEKEDNHGLVSRHFQRKYTLPSDVKIEEVQCSFTADGRLHVTAPRHPAPAVTSTTTAQNGTKSATMSDFEKMSYDSKNEASTNKDSASTSTKDTTSNLEKLREEYRQAKEDFEKTRAELLEKRAERQEEAFRNEMKAAKDTFDKSTADILTNRSARHDAFRDEVRKAQEEFDRSTSALFSRDRDDFKHSRLLRMFEPHFTAFPEFDPLPFWKRGKTSSLAEEFDKKSSMFDEFANTGRLGKTSLLENQTSAREFQGDSENFKVILDVHEFKPEELSVKTFDYYVEIEAKHEAKQDPHGFITRHFKRKYTLPRDVKATDVQCNLSSEGILVVTAPRQKPEELAKNPYQVPIQHKDTASEISGSTLRSQRIQEELNKQHHLEDQILTNEPASKTYQNTSSVHQIFTEKKPVGATNGIHRPTEHEIPITKAQEVKSTMTSTTTSTAAQKQETLKLGERVIPIDQELQSPGPRVEFPESRPESSASSIPFDFSRGKSEEPTSVASSVPPTFENLATAPGERIIKIQVAH